MLYRNLILRLLLVLPPETAQNLAEIVLRRNIPWILLGKYIKTDMPQLNTKVCGISLSSPIGLAAGFDKDFRMLHSLSELDFGYLTGGTVMLNPQPGHPKPRLIRDVKRNAILNSMGFPSKGLEFVIESVKSMSKSKLSPVFGSISGTDINAIQTSCTRLSPFVSGIEVNISSPNTSGLKTFHDPTKLSEMIRAIREITDKPLIVKLPNQVTSKIATTDVALKGKTASSSYKPATLDNGLNIQVPPFIESGDAIIVDTRTIEYVKKV